MSSAARYGSRYAGKVAWVSGGASGLGEACCLRLAGEGAQVVVADIDEAAAQATANALCAAGHWNSCAWMVA